MYEVALGRLGNEINRCAKLYVGKDNCLNSLGNLTQCREICVTDCKKKKKKTNNKKKKLKMHIIFFDQILIDNFFQFHFQFFIK